MTEKLLQYIWQFQYFNSRNLFTVDGERLQILHPGTYNTNQGPDFLDAKIKVDDTLWAGNIEMHINATDWTLHGHANDKHYSNVILHVVWLQDTTEKLPFPALELSPHVSSLLLNRYDELMQSPQFIPCQEHIQQVPALSFMAWKERMLVERLQQRTIFIELLLHKSNQHWEETFWWLLARNFGMKVNSDAFEKIAQTIPVKILARHKNQVQQLEALLMGQAALLDKRFADAYPNMLRKEYLFLQKKYGLQKAHAPLYFLRMRPANFPTVRLAQLAVLVQQSNHLFSVIREADHIKEVEKLFEVTANDYWHYHYVFDEKNKFKPKTLGAQMIQNILINTVVPALYAYGHRNRLQSLKDKALSWMEQIAPEQNRITNGFMKLGLENKSAFDSQALIQLKNEYCNCKLCLQCAIGNQVMKNTKMPG